MIYDGAFSGCKNLRKIVIPATCICGTCLKGLTNVEYVEAPYTSTQTFGEGLFGIANANLTSIKTIIINGGAIANNAFKNLPNDVTITLNGDITSIGNYAFIGTNIISFTASASLKTIGTNAFQNCKLLETVDLGSITSLGSSAFSGCSSLASVTFSNAMSLIPANAFENCTALTLITLTSSITEIGAHAFEYSGVEYINFVSRNNSFGYVTKVGEYAFAHSAIKKVMIKDADSIRLFGNFAFYECLSLTTVNTGEYHYSNGNSSSGDAISTSMFEGCTALESFTSECSSYYGFYVGKNAFKGCTNLKTVSFEALSKIGESAFEGTGIESFAFTLNSSAGTYTLSIYNYAFRNCTSLKTVSFDTVGANINFNLKKWNIKLCF